jgi:2-succinyl-5-enolpyruvyl-6-hydroxy-3-cyclohexene-1-carboxylate synthase
MAATPGVVHLNFPFREPLVPVPVEPPAGLSEADLLAWTGRADGAPWVAVHDPVPTSDTKVAQRLAEALRDARKPLIVCGPQYDSGLAAALASLAMKLNVPVLADPLSQIRWGNHDRSRVMDRYDSILRHEATASELQPDFILRIGAPPTSKTLLQFLQRNAAARQVIVDSARWPDPLLVASEVIHADPRELAVAMGNSGVCAGGVSGRGGWLSTWREANNLAGSALSTYAAGLSENFEGAALETIASVIPSGGTLFVSSSMPVRDLDSFAPGDARELRVLANRGANGIDGVVSTALGAAAVRDESSGPLVLVIGDIAFYHDMNGLLAAKLHKLDATIVVVNNDGGGIFSFLPQAADEKHFELLFGTPHGLNFAPVAEVYGARYELAETMESLRRCTLDSFRAPGLHIIEMRTGRARNVELHRDAWAEVAAALNTRCAR